MSATRELQYVCCIKKVVWTKNPEYFFEKRTWIKEIVFKNLRTTTLNFLSIPKYKTAIYWGCFKFYAASIWNDLPPPLRQKMSIIVLGLNIN